MVMDPSFWKGKKTLITGHTGFKGSWLCLWLQGKGAHTIGYALSPPTMPSLFEAAHVAEGMVSISGDIRDLEHLRKVMAEQKPEIVIHMAAQALVRYSYNNPVETYATNVMGTVNLLEAVRHTDSVKVILIITSDKCYENKEWVWGYRENDPMGGHDPYSSSKGCAELITAAYRSSYFSRMDYPSHGVAVASARAGNVIGGGDWGKDRLVPDIMRAITEGRPVVIRNPNAIRPWQHVLEPLDGYLSLVEKLWEQGAEFGEGWNFGPNDEHCRPVSWIMTNLGRLWGGNDRWELDTGGNRHEANYLRLDCSKARSLLGWSAKLDLIAALELVVEWYREYHLYKNMREFSEGQISRYENMGPA
ncbi:MAG: CDP-glucose 4,6-dehydratase [Desulfobulbaceae bacterium S5133MH15]|nr:MAG: CDP-glucose 4,6-dehydratase [Desulfobulbaceae bacterium S5133MH15]OEU78819.1 MAG: CDP-glucose 4,6-dehydratase [Desulfobulbaceae bacterium C00003063]